MKQIIVFAGTTEGRQLSEWLAGEGLEVLACVATEYGSHLVREEDHLHVRQGRLTQEEMAQLLEAEGRPLVLDATHPYATEVSRNIRTACKEADCEYLRLIRAEARSFIILQLCPITRNGSMPGFSHPKRW